MHLSLYTDLSLRLLVYLGARRGEAPVGARHVAAQFNVSAHHMHKVAQGLRRHGYIESISGRHGGLRLARRPESIALGDIVELMEGSGSLVDCQRGPCLLHGGCTLKGMLDRAERVFIDELRRHTLADVLRGPTLIRLEQLLASA